MFDYIPPPTDEDEGEGISAKVLLVCCITGVLMWLGVVSVLEFLAGVVW